MKDDRVIVDELLVKLDNVIKSGVKPKSMVNGISALLLKLDKEHQKEMKPELLNAIIATSIVKKKYKEDVAIPSDMLKRILLWQCCFYGLNDDVDDSIKRRYLYIWDSPNELYKSILESASKLSDSIEISFRVWMNLPLAINARELDKFYDAAKTTINVFYKNVEGAILEGGSKGFMPLWVFHKDIIGNETAWEKIFDNWSKCYYVYDKRKKEGLTKTGLVKHLKKLDSFSYLNLTEKELANPIHKVTNLLDEAERLILSAKRGTFPV